MICNIEKSADDTYVIEQVTGNECREGSFSLFCLL